MAYKTNSQLAFERVNKKYSTQNKATPDKSTKEKQSDKGKQSNSASSTRSNGTAKTSSQLAFDRVNQKYGLGGTTTPANTSNTTMKLTDFNTETKNAYTSYKNKTTEGGNKDSWFKGGAFDDGYDFGDTTKTVLGTVGDLGLGVVKGVGRMVEGVVDLGTYAVGGVGKLFGADDFWEDAKETARYSATDEWTKDATDYVDKYSALGNKADAISEGIGQVAAIIATAGIGAAAGLGSAGVTALTSGVTGLSSMGTNMGEAYDSGATDGEAVAYGAATGAIEAGTELLSGGLGKSVKALGVSRGIGGLDDIFAKKLSSKVASSFANESVQRVLGNTVEFGIKAGGEGFEEVLSGAGSAVMKKLTYMSDEELGKLIEDENLLDQFVVGTVVSSIAQSPSYIKANTTGTDFVTGQTSNQERAIEELAEKEIAERETNGSKLTRREKNAIYNAAMETVTSREGNNISPYVEAIEEKSKNGGTIQVAEAQKASGYGENGSKILAEAVNNATVKTFSEVKGEMHNAYMSGWSNKDISLNTDFERESYYAGKKDRAMQDLSAENKAKNATVYDSGVEQNKNFKKLSKASQELLTTLAKDHKMSVKMEDVVAAIVNGKITAVANAQHSDGKMVGSMSADNAVVEWALHEDGHRMEQMATEEWNELANALYARAERLGRVSQGSRFDTIKAQHDNAGLTLNTRGYFGEVVMREIETIFSSEKEFNAWRAELDGNVQAKNGWQKFVELLSEIIEDIKRTLSRAVMSKEARAEADRNLAELERIKELLGKAYLATKDAVTEINDAKTSENATASKNNVANGITPSQNGSPLKTPINNATAKEGNKAKSGVKEGDVFTANKTGTEYKIVYRDDKNTTVAITSTEGTKTMVISNEIADSNFSNMSDDGITKWIDEDMHIDNRSWEDVSDRKVKAFQFLFPEFQEYYMPLANELLGDLQHTIKGERIQTGTYETGTEWSGVKRLTSDAIARIKDATNASYDDIRNALERLIKDDGQENIALAKRIELVFDEMLTDGYNTFDGTPIPANEEYIAKKEELLGKTKDAQDNESSNPDEDWDWMFSLKNKNLTVNSRIPYVELKNYINVAKGDNTALNKLVSKVRKLEKRTYQNDATGYQADINSDTIRKALHPTHKKFNPFKEAHIRNLNAITKLPELFKNAVYVDSKNPQKTKNQNKAIKEYHHFVAPIFMDNGEYRALITAREKVNSNTLYVLRVEVLPTQKRHTLSAAQQNAGGSQWLSVPSDISIPELVNGVKIKNYDTNNYDTYTSADIQFSLKDSDGNTLTEAQQVYFKDSKVRDENGNLLVMYQGASEDFTVFDRKKSSYANLYGRGFYFTKSESHASQYGNTRAYYLNIKHPVSTTETTITKAQLRKFLQAVIENEDYSFENYGYDATVDSVLQSTYGKNDFLMLNDVSQTAIGDLVEAVELFNEVNRTDYDGIVLSTETVTFNSEQAKLTTNKEPTNDPDTRFSLKAPVEQTKNLIAVHNSTEKKLLGALKLGGLPSPSIAITKNDMSHEKFGDISLVFRKDSINPTDRRNKIYSGDAYTPTGVRVEYDVDDDILQEFNKKLKELTPDWMSERLPSVDSGTAEAENDSLYSAYERNDRAKLAFLREKGKAHKIAMRTPRLSYFVSNDTVIALAKAFSAKQLSDIANTSDGVKQYKNAFLKVIRDTEDSRIVETGIYSADEVSLFDISETARIAAKIKENKYKIKKEVDNRKTYELIDKKFTKALKEEYRAWIDENTKDAIIDKGIRNNRDLFTPSGKRRSFKQLHEPYNLSNIIKQMFSGEDKGVALFGGSPIGAAQHEYSSIADVKADTGRLQQLDQEEYDKIRNDIEGDVLELAEKMRTRSDVFAVRDLLSEAIGKKTKQQADAYLKRESQGWANYSPEFANELWDIRGRILNMPTEYFEAKPQRAVSFKEVAVAVLPKGKTALRKQLVDAGVQKVVYYDKGIDGDRLKKINSVSDTSFSLKEAPTTKAEKKFLNTVADVESGKKGAKERLYKYVDSGVIPTEVYDNYVKQYGAIPTGERPHREVQVPQKTAENKKVSQTVRTILEAQATPDEAVPTIEKMVEDGIFSYDVYTDKQAIADSEAYIKEYGWDESLDDWFDAVNKGEVSKELTTMGWALYNNAANIAATTTSESERTTAIKTSLKILDAMVRHQRSAAQALQATRILKKLSPETQLYGVQKSVNALQNELQEKYGDKAPDLKIDEQLAEQFINAKTPEERAEIEKEIFKDIGRQMPSRFIDKWNAWRYLAMLGNPRTHIRNILGNAGFAPIVATKNLTATAIESIVYRVSGKKTVRGKALITGSKSDRALLKAAWGDYAKVADLISNGGKYNDSAMANQQIEEGRQIFKFKPLEMARKGNSKLLETEDMWFSKPHYAYALAQYCKANNITPEQISRGKAIAPAREYAIKEAQKATYRDTNAFSQMVSEWGRKGNNDNVAKKAVSTVIEGILPFRKTPANILVRGVEYSPIGLIKGLSYDLYQVGKGKMTATEAIDNISAGLTGTGLLALGVYLAAQGIIRGHGEDEEEERKFNELMGRQSYSLELPNGQSITLDWLAPEALPFFVGVNMWEATKGSNEETNLSTILGAVSNISEPMLEMSCLQGLNDLFEGIGYASSNDTSGLVSVLSSAVTSYLTQGIPTLTGQAERTGEEERMTTYTEKNGFLTGDMQYTLGKASAKIPFWDYNQIPYIDAWGRREASGTALKRGFNNFLNPAYTSTIESSYMEKELLRLYEQTGETKVFPTRADKYFTVDGGRKDLTAEEYVRYATLKGEKSYKLINDLVNSNAYRKLSDDEKIKAIEEAYDYANQKAKQAISNYKPATWVGKADEFGSNVENYLSFRANVSNTKADNGGKISKQEIVDIVLDTTQNDSDIWKMYLTEYDSTGDMYAYEKGIEGKDYMYFLNALNEVDTPTKSGKYGSYTQDEATNAVNSLTGLSREEKAALWQSVNTNWKKNPFR